MRSISLVSDTDANITNNQIEKDDWGVMDEQLIQAPSMSVSNQVEGCSPAMPLNNAFEINIFTLAGDKNLERAFQWLCKQRAERHFNNSVWDLRFNWHRIKPKLQRCLLAGEFRLSPLRSYKINNKFISSWEAIDSLVLKALSYTLQPLFSHDDYPQCTHLKNAGGIHSALKQVAQHKADYQHILKSDVYHYYESIDHDVLLSLLKEQVTCPTLLTLVSQYCQRLEIRDGHYYHFKHGIPMGCPISPLMAALYLKPLDDEMQKHGFYVRFMDDWLIMVKTKHQLRKIIKLTYLILKRLKLKMHPDKTFLGCLRKGFNFLGVHFGDTPCISDVSKENHRSKLAQRYAQNASITRIESYIARWTLWCHSILNSSGSVLNLINSVGQEDNHGKSLMDNPKEQKNERNIKYASCGI